ncbi:MAG: RIP metalloprotease RseP [Acidobacteriia bacterium]|nr:RIP metalloprotease RseP [Terriglobia bacterium]MBV8904283.1 RIP metalloprotease RseP [Terriglobia bacterium]
MQVLENVVWWLVLIGVMIMIHELGHFWAARFFDVKVETFSFGFGPRLFGFRRGETDYRFSALLFGGYVRMAGEQMVDAAGVDVSDPRGLLAKPRWQRAIIAFAGPFMNLVLAVGLLTGLYMVKYQKVADEDMRAVIGHVAADSPAAKAGLQDGDRLVKLDDKTNPTWEDIDLKQIASAGQPLFLTVERNGKRFNTSVIPTLSESTGSGYVGWDERGEVQLAAVEAGYPAEKAGLKKGDILVAVNGQPIHSPTKFQEMTRSSGGKPIRIEYQRNGETHTVTVQPVYSKLDGPARWMIGVGQQQKLHLIATRLSFPDALRESFRENSKGALLFVQVIEGIIRRSVSARIITGPIGIAQLSGDAAREGPSAFVMLMSMVSLQLAILNLLPIPIFDGFSILTLAVEMVMQRDLSLNVKEALFRVGFVFIMMLLAFVIYNDISKILPAG